MLFCQAFDETYETLLLEEEEVVTGMAFKPVIGAGVGVFSFFGDVNDYFGSPVNGLSSYRISIGRSVGNNFDVEFHGTVGEVSANSYDGNPSNSQNFHTSLFLGGVSLYYNFNHLLTRKRPIHPYFSLGVEAIQFTPKGDIYNGNGLRYHYWDDGTIRDLPQEKGVAGNIITQDFNYESDLRELDLYGYGIYSKTSVAVPVDVGLNFAVSDRVTFRIGAVMHLSATDYIDNYKKGLPDFVLNTYACLTVDMFSEAAEIAAVENFRNLKYLITDGKDYDMDGVDDFNDECPGTPAEAKVNYKGCPLDRDKDGVPDYLDLDNETPIGTIAVGANGIKIMDAHVIAILYDPESVKRSDRKLYAEESEAAAEIDPSKGIPAKFKPVDTNGDKYISHEELQKAIDSIFEGNSTLTPDDIYELQQFFFNQ